MSILELHHQAAEQRSTRRVLLLANRRARRGQSAIQSAADKLQGLGFEVTLALPAKPAEFGKEILQHRDKVDLVVIGGGDGTLNAAVDALIAADLPLGVLPLGTANDLARTLGIPADLDAACRIIASGSTRRIDLGWVNGKHFLNVASLGLSVAIARRMHGETKRRLGVLAYLVTAMRVLARSRPFHAEITSVSGTWKVKTLQIAVGNGRFYGGGMAVAEDASIEDQRLDLYSLEVQRGWQVVTLLPSLWRGRLRRLPNVRTHHGKWFKIRTRRPRHINTDGEITTKTPATFRLVPAGLRVFAPASESSEIRAAPH